MQKTWFVSDCHFGHQNIMKFHDRVFKIVKDKKIPIKDEHISVHDNALIELWNETIARQDIVYILGDFSFHNKQDTKKILDKLHGQKHLIIGNHDSSASKLEPMFKSVSHIKDVVFKKSTYDFLEEDFHVIMCHYPMLSWQSRNYGSVNVHGHCHGFLDSLNNDSGELRVDIGVDGELAKNNNFIISLEKLYEHFRNIAKDKSLHKYVKDRIAEAKTIAA